MRNCRMALSVAAVALAGVSATPVFAAPTLLTDAPAGTTTTFNGTTFKSYAPGSTATINGLQVTSPATFYENVGGYNFGINGRWNALTWVGTSSSATPFTFDLGGNFLSAGAFVNYAPGFGSALITALDAAENVIGSFDVSVLAPISTPGEIDAGAFRGIQSDTGNIRYLRLSGAYIAANSVTRQEAVAAVPEPATWAMMLVGFGGIGFAMRRRKSKVTTTVAYA